MGKKVVTEIVSFDIDSSISIEAFKEIVDSVERDFHMVQPGYIDSELVKGNNNSWTMIMHWESLEDVKLASKNLMKSDLAEAFRQAVIPSTVRMSFLEQIMKWSK
jgi:heme-degrading monooxygenase HmoA